MEDGVPRAKEVDAYHRAPERLDEARLEGELTRAPWPQHQPLFPSRRFRLSG